MPSPYYLFMSLTGAKEAKEPKKQKKKKKKTPDLRLPLTGSTPSHVLGAFHTTEKLGTDPLKRATVTTTFVKKYWSFHLIIRRI